MDGWGGFPPPFFFYIVHVIKGFLKMLLLLRKKISGFGNCISWNWGGVFIFEEFYGLVLSCMDGVICSSLNDDKSYKTSWLNSRIEANNEISVP